MSASENPPSHQAVSLAGGSSVTTVARWWNRFFEWLVKEDIVPATPDFGQSQPPDWALVMFEALREELRRVLHQLGTLQLGEESIMAEVQIDQTDLDNIAASLESLVTVVNALPQGALPAANETALQQAVTDITTAVNAVSAADNPPAAPTS